MTPEEARRARSCIGKIRHASMKSARKAIKRMKHYPGSSTLSAYRCPYCLGCHVGHTQHKAKGSP